MPSCRWQCQVRLQLTIGYIHTLPSLLDMSKSYKRYNYHAQDVLNFPINNFWGKKYQFSTENNVFSCKKLLSLYLPWHLSSCLYSCTYTAYYRQSLCTNLYSLKDYAVPFIVQYSVLVDRLISLSSSDSKEVRR